MSGELNIGNSPGNFPGKGEEFHIIGGRDLDSSHSQAWKEYFQSDKLRNAWLTLADSPYRNFCRTELIDSVAEQIETIRNCRYSDGERRSEEGIANLIKTGELGNATAVILDSGGAHSVAMAMTIMKIGYQPVIMFANTPTINGRNRCEQALATMLYFAEEAMRLKEQGVYNASSPPVFIMDSHRSDRPFDKNELQDNSYQYKTEDLPDAALLISCGINKIVYLNEGDQKGLIQPDFQSTDRLANDLKPRVVGYGKAGLDVKYTGVDPSYGRLDFPGLSFRF